MRRNRSQGTSETEDCSNLEAVRIRPCWSADIKMICYLEIRDYFSHQFCFPPGSVFVLWVVKRMLRSDALCFVDKRPLFRFSQHLPLRTLTGGKRG